MAGTFFSVWVFNEVRADYDCIGIYTNASEAHDLAAKNAFKGGPAPVLEHDDAQVLIDQLLWSRLGTLADHLRRLEIFAGTLPAIPKPDPAGALIFGMKTGSADEADTIE